MSVVSYRCERLPSQPLMDRIRCIARGKRPEHFDQCVGCVCTIQRKATISYNEEDSQSTNQEG